MEQIAVPVRLGKEEARLVLVKDPDGPTGYRFLSLNDNETPGCPASLFSVALYRAYVRLMYENKKLLGIIEKRDAVIQKYKDQRKVDHEQTPTDKDAVLPILRS